jgi:diguanylate cyclase (GGDEF)-like protein
MAADRSPGSEPQLHASSWLCRGDFDRGRMLDMELRVRPVRMATFVILAVAIAFVGPTSVGWWPVLCLIPAALFFVLADILMPRMARPEFLMFAAWIGSELIIAGAVAIEGGTGVVALAWLAIPVITLSSRFSIRGVVAGVTIAALLVVAVAFAADASAVAANPSLVTAPLALIVCVAVLSIPLMRSDIQHRSDAVVDQLTGMLNRKALSGRVQELAQQSALTGEPIGVIVGDLDHFKQVNDTYGHGVGDAVLKDVAYILRKHLRAFDLAYRLGGEEFLILLPGSEVEQARELAERLREGVAAEPVGGCDLSVTMSFGVHASGRDETFDYPAVFSTADGALYEAKRQGRNRVCLAVEHEAVAVAA